MNIVSYDCDLEGLMFTHVLVTSSHNGDNTGLEKSLNSTVDSLGLVTTKGHVHNSLASTVVLLDIVDDELHALKDTRVATTT